MGSIQNTQVLWQTVFHYSLLAALPLKLSFARVIPPTMQANIHFIASMITFMRIRVTGRFQNRLFQKKSTHPPTDGILEILVGGREGGGSKILEIQAGGG